MEKEILIQNLRTKLGADKSSVISDRTMESLVEDWLPSFADDTKITDDTWKFPIKVLTNYAGQKLHDDAAFSEKYKKDYEAQKQAEIEKKIREASDAAVAKYIKEHPVTDPKPQDPPTLTEEEKLNKAVADAVATAMAGLTKEDGVIGKLSATVSDFIKKNEETARELSVKDAKTKLVEYLKNEGADSDPTIEDALKDIEYGEKIDLEELKAKVKAAYEARYKRYYGDGAKPLGGSNANHDANVISEEVKKYIEAKKKNAEDSTTYQKQLQERFV